MRVTTSMRMAAMMALAASGALAASALPEAAPEPGSAKNRPSGNTRVPGGGERERVRRITRKVRHWMFHHPDPGGVTREQVIDHINSNYADLPWHLQDAVLEASI